MPMSMEERFSKDQVVLQFHYKAYETLSKQLSLQLNTNINNYIEAADQTRQICQSIYQNYQQIMLPSQNASIHQIQNKIILELAKNLSSMHKIMKNNVNSNAMGKGKADYCQFCNENMEENKIKRMKMALQEDYRQQFYLVLEQLKRLSQQKIFTQQENKQFEQLLVAQLNQKQKILKINDTKMQQFIEILNTSLAELKKIKDTIFPEQQIQNKESSFKTMNRLNQHISSFLQASFQKKIPPWIHKMFERVMQMYMQSINGKKRDYGVQANLDDPELRMAKAQNRQLTRNNKQLNKQIIQLKQDYKTLYNFKSPLTQTNNSRQQLQMLLIGLNERRSVSPKDKSRRSTVKRSKRNGSKSSRRGNNSKRNSVQINEQARESQTQEEEITDMILNNWSTNKKKKDMKNVKNIQKRKNESIVKSEESVHKNSGFFFPDIHRKRQSIKNAHQVSMHEGSTQIIENQAPKKTTNHLSQITQHQQDKSELQKNTQKNKQSITERNKQKKEKQKDVKNNKDKKSVLLNHKKSFKKSIIANEGSTNIKSSIKNPVQISRKSGIKNHNSIIQNKIRENSSIKDSGPKKRESQSESSQASCENKSNLDKSEIKEKIRKVSQELAQNASKKLEQLHGLNISLSAQSNKMVDVGSIRRYDNSCFQSEEGAEQIPEQLPAQNRKTHGSPIKNYKIDKSNSHYSIKHDRLSNSKTDLHCSSLASLSPQKIEHFEMQRKTLQNFSKKIFDTMKKHHLLPQVLDIQEFQAIIREQTQKKDLLEYNGSSKMKQIKQNINPLEEDSFYCKNLAKNNHISNPLKNIKNLSSNSTCNSPKYQSYFHSLFYSKKHAYKYEQNLSKTYHKRINRVLTSQEKAFSLQLFSKLVKIRQQNRSEYNKICSVIRYPFDCLYNDFETINFITQMKYETFEYYFQKIMVLHKVCDKNEVGICEHVQLFFNKI